MAMSQCLWMLGDAVRMGEQTLASQGSRSSLHVPPQVKEHKADAAALNTPGEGCFKMDQANSRHKGQGRPLQARRLTRTAMASGKGPLVLRLSLVSSAACSHSRPSAMKVLLAVSLPLGLRMKLPVTWFFTAGQGTGTEISIPLYRGS